MYTKNSLDKYPTFKNIIKKYGMINLLDPLTKTILRGHMMTFVDELIKAKQQFYLMIIDVDNFKQVNDNYGHQVGDEILKDIGSSLVEIVGDYGLVGRYGGDEFIIVDLYHQTYDSIHEFLERFYMCEESVFRRSVHASNVSVFVTGTIGTANFPNDAIDYDDLFYKADKALYRGKTKGRNCFIIYVESKHKDIDINLLIKEPIQDTLYELLSIFDLDMNLNDKLEKAFSYVSKKTKISDIFVFDKNNALINDNSIVVPEISEFIDSDIDYAVYNTIDEVNGGRAFDSFLKIHPIACLLITRIKFKGKVYGHLAFGDTIVQRIWQNEDIALLLFLMRLIAVELYLLDK